MEANAGVGVMHQAAVVVSCPLMLRIWEPLGGSAVKMLVSGPGIITQWIAATWCLVHALQESHVQETRTHRLVLGPAIRQLWWGFVHLGCKIVTYKRTS